MLRAHNIENKIWYDLSKEFKSLIVYCFNERRGKPTIINELFNYSKGEILVITDANVFPDADSMKLLISCFDD